jgi:hypothetical protein
MCAIALSPHTPRSTRWGRQKKGSNEVGFGQGSVTRYMLEGVDDVVGRVLVEARVTRYMLEGIDDVVGWVLVEALDVGPVNEVNQIYLPAREAPAQPELRRRGLGPGPVWLQWLLYWGWPWLASGRSRCGERSIRELRRAGRWRTERICLVRLKDWRMRWEGWIGANQNFSRKLGLYPKINPTSLFSNSTKTA